MPRRRRFWRPRFVLSLKRPTARSNSPAAMRRSPSQESGAVSWESTSQAGPFTLRCRAKLECDGYVNFRLTLGGERPQGSGDAKRHSPGNPVAPRDRHVHDGPGPQGRIPPGKMGLEMGRAATPTTSSGSARSTPAWGASSSTSKTAGIISICGPRAFTRTGATAGWAAAGSARPRPIASCSRLSPARRDSSRVRSCTSTSDWPLRRSTASIRRIGVGVISIRCRGIPFPKSRRSSATAPAF